MKKILTIALMVAGTFSVLAQGTVTFNNSASSLVMNSATSAAAEGGGRFLLALYYGPLGTSSDISMVQIGATTGIFPSPGRYSGGTRTTPATTAPGASAVFQVRGWEAIFGSTYEAALANPAAQSGGLFGKSGLFTSATGGAGSPPGAAVALSSTALGFNLVAVPEPSTYALGLLGAGALMFMRRRRA